MAPRKKLTIRDAKGSYTIAVTGYDDCLANGCSHDLDHSHYYSDDQTTDLWIGYDWGGGQGRLRGRDVTCKRIN